MPHSAFGAPFLNTIGGKPRFGEPLLQSEVEKRLDAEHTRLALRLLFSLMQPRDTLKLFTVEPDASVQRFASRGIALCRGTQCVTGIVTQWASNPGYQRDVEEHCDEAEIAEAFGEQWSEIKDAIPAGAQFVRFRSSPMSWQHLCGRAGYAIKVAGNYSWTIVTALN